MKWLSHPKLSSFDFSTFEESSQTGTPLLASCEQSLGLSGQESEAFLLWCHQFVERNETGPHIPIFFLDIKYVNAKSK